MKTLVLASASPRRRELLERVGLTLDVRPADVDESALIGETPAAYVGRIARAKAAAVPRFAGSWVLAADTTVTIDGQILAKASSPAEATDMLRRISGRVHQVMTAFVVLGDGVVRERMVTSNVEMITIAPSTLADYVASNEWRGKAGAYAIQGIGAALVRGVNGSVTNVIGLPLVEVLEVLRDVGGPTPRFTAGLPA